MIGWLLSCSKCFLSFDPSALRYLVRVSYERASKQKGRFISMSSRLAELTSDPKFDVSDIQRLLRPSKSRYGCAMWNGPFRNHGSVSHPVWRGCNSSSHGWPVRDILWWCEHHIEVPKGYWLYSTCGNAKCSGVGLDGRLHVFAAKSYQSKKFYAMHTKKKAFPYSNVVDGFWCDALVVKDNVAVPVLVETERVVDVITSSTIEVMEQCFVCLRWVTEKHLDDMAEVLHAVDRSCIRCYNSRKKKEKDSLLVVNKAPDSVKEVSGISNPQILRDKINGTVFKIREPVVKDTFSMEKRKVDVEDVDWN